MTRIFSTLLLTLSAASFFPGCAVWQKLHGKGVNAHQGAAPRPVAVLSIGTIVLVNSEASFVLIDNGMRPSPAVGSKAQSRSTDGTTAELRITEIRKRPFAIADIVQGTPKKGDEVFQ